MIRFIVRCVLSDIQAKKVAEEEEARRLAEEALAKKKAEEEEARRLAEEAFAKKKAEEEEARRLAKEALAQKKLQARKAKEAAEKTLTLNSLWALADAFQRRSFPDMTRETLFRKLVKLNPALDHEDDTASPIQPVHMPTQYGKEVNYENDMKPLDASSSQPLDELNKSTQNVSLEDKAAVQEGGIGSAQLL
ncbi:hypothetical protein MtrunA17_Chr7g0217851 [Medicago truncatula]|uniref:Uncharacterized protein n=1 Tax=Medicago truncatula TaxID=3880 RepID=A0A396GZL8_MEDTR|nr:hypothetical protein MtrunA17_Chr7g0217851 [Medicago truncatula]